MRHGTYAERTRTSLGRTVAPQALWVHTAPLPLVLCFCCS